ncbi:Hypothetical protein PBC10988_7460 [Planctomycetales bacterium 10988]|nr:Hypothetical protein PBC10988_7460 [Planctomycetales bacterium 10988]
MDFVIAFILGFIVSYLVRERTEWLFGYIGRHYPEKVPFVIYGLVLVIISYYGQVLGFLAGICPPLMYLLYRFYADWRHFRQREVDHTTGQSGELLTSSRRPSLEHDPGIRSVSSNSTSEKINHSEEVEAEPVSTEKN